MEREKRKWGDRKDGIWLKDLPAMNRIMPGIMPNRVDNEAHINVEVDLRPLDAYLAQKNQGRTEDKYTYFHVISAAIAKAFVLRPRMNRFICNKRIYQHRDVTPAFVVKKPFLWSKIPIFAALSDKKSNELRDKKPGTMA